MKTSDKGRFAIALHEGIVPGPYLDIAKVWTFGIGHAATSGRPPDPRTLPRGMPADLDRALREAVRVFEADLAVTEAAVSGAVKVALAQHEFDALVSFTFNLGPGALAKSTLLRKLNAGDRQGAANEFKRWINAGGKIVPALQARRAQEKAMFLSGEYTTAQRVPVWRVETGGRVVWSAIRHVTFAEWQALAAGVPASSAPPQRTFWEWLKWLWRQL